MKIHRTLLLGSLICLLGACDLVNPEEDIPAYLHVQPFQLSVNPIGEGSASANITEAWLTVNGNFLGAYALPATIPILASGSAEVKLSPGIRENGIAALPDIYLVYRDFVQTVDLTPAEVDTIQPTTGYLSSLRFLLEPQEGFESSTFQLAEDLDNNPDSKIVRTTSEVFEGTHSGHIQLTDDVRSIEVGSRFFQKEDLATGAQVYFEMDYKTDITVVIGVLGYDQFGTRIFEAFDKGVNPRSDWNKIYFNFTEEILVFNGLTEASFYQFCMHSQLNPDQTEGNIYLDNLKWITF